MIPKNKYTLVNYSGDSLYESEQFRFSDALLEAHHKGIDLTEVVISNVVLDRFDCFLLNKPRCTYSLFQNCRVDGSSNYINECVFVDCIIKNPNKYFINNNTFKDCEMIENEDYSLRLPQIVPEVGYFIGFKQIKSLQPNGLVINCIAMLHITKDAKRSSASGRKCRCSKARVLSITNISGNNSYQEGFSWYDPDFKYHVGQMVEEPNFDENTLEECTRGIHFFLTRAEAINF